MTGLYDDFIDEARAVPVMEFLERQPNGHQLKKHGKEFIGPCPVCGGTDRFSVNTAKNIFNCRQGAVGGDAIALAKYISGNDDFFDACELVLGRARPGREPGSVATISEEQRAKNKAAADAARAESEAKEKAWKAKGTDSAAHLFEAGLPLRGSHAGDYLTARGMVLTREFCADLRFIPMLDYWGTPSADSKEQVLLGSFPAMVAAIRAADGALIGAHRTYLDPQEPRKLTPPGSPDNPAKKVLGSQLGGLIRLSPVKPIMAIGEGIETTGAWRALPDMPGVEDVGIAAAVSMGNMAGGCTGAVPHPRAPKKRVPNGEPDPGKPGMVMPAGVREVILLGDGDSEPVWTRARLVCAGRRQRVAGVIVSVHMAPDDKDWSDVLKEMAEAA